MGFSRQEYWSGLPFSPPGDLPDPGIEPMSPTLKTGYLLSELSEKPKSFISPGKFHGNLLSLEGLPWKTDLLKIHTYPKPTFSCLNNSNDNINVVCDVCMFKGAGNRNWRHPLGQRLTNFFGTWDSVCIHMHVFLTGNKSFRVRGEFICFGWNGLEDVTGDNDLANCSC